MIEFLTGTLVREPRRVGKQLRRELAGDDTREVIVLGIEHRHVYRPR